MSHLFNQELLVEPEV